MPDMIKLIVDTAGQEGHGSFVYVESQKEIMIGRHTGTTRLDLPLYNQLVSKQHCRITRQHNEVYIEDLGSKNGTELNGQRLQPYRKYPVADGDQLTLVNGLVGLRLERGVDFEETREYRISDLLEHEIRLNDYLQNIQVSGDSITLSKKEYQLFKMLYNCLDHFVTREQIVREVWPERCVEDAELVGVDEVNSLIYRTNKKLGDHFVIKSVYKKGVYMKKQSQNEEIDTVSPS
ncbi:FHA domain-containing protein [Paenibacillus wulumuqiensis]|uniref:FHA domain-containing protein n=1 Tax=Paenibacillus wulumuqiensis TaxID=1567107 RepID=UPI0006194723|nr:FHA domain-containing protein [Paenibacillus wulumuqiensis]